MTFKVKTHADSKFILMKLVVETYRKSRSNDTFGLCWQILLKGLKLILGIKLNDTIMPRHLAIKNLEVRVQAFSDSLLDRNEK
jgi:hypothetical protein